MNFRERIFHAVLFELLLLVLSVLVLNKITGHGMGGLAGLLAAISLIAMACNVVFNWLFDKVFTGARERRGTGVRVLHTVLFELSLLVFTLPLIVYVLDIGWWDALVMDIGMAVAVMVYTYVFNWCYDHIRAAWLRHRGKR